eukprot:scaffold8718_cov159-Isochrysis_galbana.AAC.7
MRRGENPLLQPLSLVTRVLDTQGRVYGIYRLWGCRHSTSLQSQSVVILTKSIEMVKAVVGHVVAGIAHTAQSVRKLWCALSAAGRT